MKALHTMLMKVGNEFFISVMVRQFGPVNGGARTGALRDIPPQVP